MKKVLILSYYWPPAGGPGVQRWLKFVKYLRQFSWEPVVYTVANPSYAVVDNSLESEIPEGIEVLRKEIFEPYEIANFLSASKKADKTKGGFIESKSNSSFFSKLTTWIRGNFFIPDARYFWIRPSVKFLDNYLSKNKVDAIVSSGPPHSLHLIALELKRRHNIKWVSDFRDPWTKIDYYDKLMLSSWADNRHRKLEKLVLDNSDAVIVVGNTMKEEFSEITNSPIHVLENGFDFYTSDSEEVELDTCFSISHIGSMNADRNPKTLWSVIAQLIDEIPEFKNDLRIKLIGSVSEEIIDNISDQNLSEYLEHIQYVDHSQVYRYQKSSAVLLLVLNNTINSKGILTGKMFEYFKAQRPILCIGPEDGDAAKIIDKTKSGSVFDYNNSEDLKKHIADLYFKFKNGTLRVEAGEDIEQYSRKSITKRLSVLLDSLNEGAI